MGSHDADFLVRPLDTVWCRGPKPFVAGEDSVDPGAFPPTPWTFQGLVRTRLLLAALPGDLDAAGRRRIAELVGPPDRLPDGWRLEGPFPAAARGGGTIEAWFQAPRFLLDPGAGRPPLRARPAPELAALSDLPPGQLLLGRPREAVPAALGGWISAANLAWALTGAGAWDPAGHHRELPPFVAPESRPGIRVEPATGTAADHLIYAATQHRFRAGSGLLGRLIARSDPSIPDDALHAGWAQLGRRGRLVEFQTPVRVSAPWQRLRTGAHFAAAPAAAPLPDPLLVWVVLLTPAVADGTGPPFPIAAAAARCRVLGHLTAPGPDLGGFDRAAGGGRPVRACWAAGSAWLIEIAGGAPIDRLAAARALHGLPPHLPDTQEALGFGQRLAGLLDPRTHLPLHGGTDAA